MANVVFDEDDASDVAKKTKAAAAAPGGTAGFLIRKGIAKDVSSANLILLAVTVAIFFLAGFIYYETRTVPIQVKSVNIPLNQI
jgi:hypothetical protein